MPAKLPPAALAAIARPRTLAALFLIAYVSALAQPQKLAFEVASIRLSEPGTRGSQRVTPTRVDLINIQLQAVLLMAFRLEPYRLSAPSWLNDVRVDINATLPGGATRAQVPEMLRTLLAERFGLITHVEPRSMDAWDLVVDKSGIRMREVQPADDLAKEFPSDPKLRPVEALLETVDGPVRMMPTNPPGLRTVTDRMLYERTYTARRTTEINAIRMTMAELARLLETNVDQPVIDATGLTGLYQFTIELPPDARTLRMMAAAGTTTTLQGTPLNEPTGVSTFKAVEGLGLRLERRRAPIDVLVVDSIQRTPTSN